jgi:hypothetical protein
LGVTVTDVITGGAVVKLAVTVVLPFITTVQVTVMRSVHPVHEAKLSTPAVAGAVKVTDVPVR